MENRSRKRQRCSEETTVHPPQPTTMEHSPSTMNIPHDSTLPVSIRMGNTAQAMSIPDVNVVRVVDPPDSASHSSKVAIPNKRRNPFGGGGLRKKKKIERYVDVRIYAQRKDLGHTHEIQCALTPDGGLDLMSLSQELKLKGCEASCSPSVA